jgi:hypothetical protein
VAGDAVKLLSPANVMLEIQLALTRPTRRGAQRLLGCGERRGERVGALFTETPPPIACNRGRNFVPRSPKPSDPSRVR